MGSDLESCMRMINAVYQVSVQYPHTPSCDAEFLGPTVLLLRSYTRRDNPRHGVFSSLSLSCEKVCRIGTERESGVIQWLRQSGRGGFEE